MKTTRAFIASTWWSCRIALSSVSLLHNRVFLQITAGKNIKILFSWSVAFEIGIVYGLIHFKPVLSYQKSPILPTNHWLNMCWMCYFAGKPVCWSGSKCGDYSNKHTEIITNTYTGRVTYMSNLPCCLTEILDDLTCWLYLLYMKDMIFIFYRGCMDFEWSSPLLKI